MEWLSEKQDLKPLVRLKLTGTLAKGLSNSDISLEEIEKKFGEKAIFSIAREFDSNSFKAKIAELRALQKTKKSVSAIGLELLEKNLAETGFGKSNVKELLELLEQGENEKALAMIEEEN